MQSSTPVSGVSTNVSMPTTAAGGSSKIGKKIFELKTDTPELLQSLDQLASILFPTVPAGAQHHLGSSSHSAVQSSLSSSSLNNTNNGKDDKNKSSSSSGSDRLGENAGYGSGSMGMNTMETRRNLRTILERKNLEISNRFLEEMSPIEKFINQSSSEIDIILKECDNILNKFSVIEMKTEKFIHDINILKNKKQSLTQQYSSIEVFLNQYQLSEEQLEAIQKGPFVIPNFDDDDEGNNNNNNGENMQGNDDDAPGKRKVKGDIDLASSQNPLMRRSSGLKKKKECDFFDALDQIRRIRDQSKELLSTQYQSAGIEIFDEMSAHQEKAHEKIYKWIQQRCSTVINDNNQQNEGNKPTTDDEWQIEMNETNNHQIMKRSLRALRDVPAYYRSCQELIANSRSVQLIRNFNYAIVRGESSHGKYSRPIQMHAHDPIRYVGDILAWIHQALALEKEYLNDIFNIREFKQKAASTPLPPPSVSSVNDESEDSTATNIDVVVDSVDDIIVRIFSSLSVPLSARIEQAIQNISNFLIAFKLAKLIEFYKGTLETMFPTSTITLAITYEKEGKPKLHSNTLLKTLDELRELCIKVFFHMVEAKSEKLLNQPPSFPKDLSVSPDVQGIVARMTEVLNAEKSSLSASVPTDMVNMEAKTAEFEPILRAFITPLVKLVKSSSQILDVSDRNIYFVNNLVAATTSLKQFEFTAQIVQELTNEIEDALDLLASDQAKNLLRNCKIQSIMEIVRKHNNEGESNSSVDWSKIPEVNEQMIRSSLDSFYKLIDSTFAASEFDKLNHPRLRTQARTSMSQILSSAYDVFYSMISTYSFETRSGIYTPTQVKELVLA